MACISHLNFSLEWENKVRENRTQLNKPTSSSEDFPNWKKKTKKETIREHIEPFFSHAIDKKVKNTQQ